MHRDQQLLPETIEPVDLNLWLEVYGAFTSSFEVHVNELEKS